MCSYVRKTAASVLLITFLVSICFPGYLFARDTNVRNPNEESQQVKIRNPVTQDKSKINYGPYNGADNAKKHAYEPFKKIEKNENKDAESTAFKKDRVLVKIDTAKYSQESLQAKSTPFTASGVIKFEKVFKGNSEKGNEVQSAGRPGKTNAEWYRAYVKDGTDIISAVESISKMPGVVSAEPDYLRSLSELSIPDPSTDVQIGEQWYLDKVGVKQAWSYLQSQGINPGGRRDVVVAVIDTGVDYRHPDLSGNIWTNTGEIPGNGIDDDKNGFVDDIHGACTVGDRYSGESGNPLDDHGHGTHVAGIIAAQGNNNTGGAGVAYNVQIMPVKAAQSSGVLSASDIAQAIYYAVDKGADVINMSFGGYGRSTVEEDALEVAFGTSVLVAAAGNDGRPNLPHPKGIDMYPAAYPWVLGVMAENQSPAANGDNLASFSNWDYISKDSHEYEVMAPGVDVFSTLPDEKYGKWNGTSMAAPVVSGIAALTRSKFADKNTYSSRFIMGQIASTGMVKQGKTHSQSEPPTMYHEVDAYRALIDTPKPKLSYLEHYIFDKSNIAPENDGDGVVDAGETVDIAMVIRNHWGKADNVQVRIDTDSPAGISDPYVTFLTDTVEYGAVGTFAADDNGLIYDAQGAITGVSTPFKLKVAGNTPNDHVIPVNVTITGKNGFDINDQTVYASSYSFSIMVRRARELPRIISQNMTLTKDDYWLIPDKTLIEKGVTVTAQPGTQIQFWSADPADPYSEQLMPYLQVEGSFVVNGTADEPVEMFAGSLYAGYEVKTYKPEGTGYIELNYAKIANPRIDANIVNHCYFSQDLFSYIYYKYLSSGQVYNSYTSPYISAGNIRNSRFYKLGGSWGKLSVNGKVEECLFDSCYYYMNNKIAENNVYLKNYKQTGSSYYTSSGESFGNTINLNSAFQSVFPVKYNQTGSTYIAVKPNSGATGYDEMKQVEKFANSLGGHIVTIDDAEENEIVRLYINNYIKNSSLLQATYPNIYHYDFYNSNYIIGINDFEQEGIFKWISSESAQFTNWKTGEPDNKYSSYSGSNYVCIDPSDGKWYDYGSSNRVHILEVSGTVDVTGVDIPVQSLTLGKGDPPTALNAVVLPEKASDKTVTWSSSEPTVAGVDSNGFVTPLEVGTTTITVTTKDGGFTDKCEVTVIQKVPATGINLNKASLTLPINQSETLQANVLPEGATNKNVTWSSDNNSVASVDSRGRVTAVSEGSANITVKTDDGGYIAVCNVSVVVPVTGITLDKSILRLVAGGENGIIQANVMPANATDKRITWRSSNKAIAEVDANGIVTPISEGTAMITATTIQGGLSASCMVTVSAQAMSFVTTKISAGYYHTVALNDDGKVWTWGRNDYGQLGDGTTINRSAPVQVKNLSDVLAVAAGRRDRSHTVALKADGTVWTWGYNAYGQLGIGYYDYSSNSTPVKVQNLTDVIAISAGYYHTVALKADGTVWAWGDNEDGQIGDGTTTNRYSPVQVENLTDIIAISAGGSYTVALKSDGTVWAWGYNGNGQLGDGTTSRRYTPVQVQNLTGVMFIAAGDSHTAAVKQEGTVWTWGNNNYGQLGDGTTQWRNVPVQVQNLVGITAISAGYLHTAAVKQDGIIWAWGYNEGGQLCDGTTINRSAPVWAQDLMSVTSISAGGFHTAIIKEDGLVWTWGGNSYGQLGNYSNNSSSVPVQVLIGVVPDTFAPQVVSTNPAANAVGVTTDTDITVTFNEDIKSGTDYGYISIKDSSGKIISLKRKVIDGNVLTLEPLNALLSNTVYTVTIKSNSLKDVFNNPFTSDYSFSFTTVQSSSTSMIGGDVKTTGSAAAESINDVRAAYVDENGKVIITQQDIDAVRLALIESGELTTIKNNAILNVWWDPDVEHWMRFISAGGRDYRQYLSQNYWGTTSKTLIDKAIVDYNDDFNKAKVIYEPLRTTAPESCYPFVTDVYVSTQTEERASKVGAEKVTVHVLFNRDMNRNIEPQVSFGPDVPNTDYTVHGVNGGWLDARHWIGEYDITPVTGDGYQLFRVAGAAAADDPWLVTGNDSERFRFEIITSGTEAMNLQASGAEGNIILSWAQDDFDLLAGYNIYRSDTISGTYTKINNTVIPKEQKTYEDTNVVPGKVYYYKFKVVKTDLTESDFSNVASAAALDTVPPAIAHTPVKGAAPGLALQVYADVTDNVSVAKVSLYYRKSGSTAYAEAEMVKTTGSRYSATVEGSLVQAPGLEYYIEATDGISIVRNGSADRPNQVVITDAPKITSVAPTEGPDDGGTEVIITGANFKQGASVTFGGAPASNVIVENTNRITAAAPAHLPETVDVSVANTDGYKDTMLRGFTYKKEGVEVNIPSVQANKGTVFEVPINVVGVSGLSAADIKVAFDKDVLSVRNVRSGSIAANFTLQSNKSVLGEVSISMASATSSSGSGPLAYIEFEVLNTTKASSPLTLQNIQLNSGAIVATPVNGIFTVSTTHSISGSISSYTGSLPVSGVDLKLEGLNTYTAASGSNGSYTINDVVDGAYKLTASKSNEAAGISAYDASLVLQSAAGLLTLTANQKIAADVDNNGKVDSMDASYVLKKVAGLIEVPFPGAGKVWTFVPSERNYTSLVSNLTGQNFTAILLGDVSGNWTNTGSGIQGGSTAEFTIDTKRAEPGSTITLPVRINTNQGKMYGSEIVVSYDKNALTALSVDKAGLSNNFTIAANLSTPGIIRIAMAGAQPLSGNDVLLNISFKVADNTYSVPVELDKADVNENAAEAVKTSGKIIVAIKGDANLDNKVDDSDLELAKESYGLIDKDIDMNGDGRIDLYDMVTIGKNIGSQRAAGVSSVPRAAVSPGVQIDVPNNLSSVETFDVKVNVSNVSDFFGGSFDMLFDPNVVKVMGITHGRIFGTKESLVKDVMYRLDNVNGKFEYCRILTTNTPGISASGTFVTIHFKVVGDGQFRINSTMRNTQGLVLSGVNTRLMLSDGSSMPLSYTVNNVSKDIVKDSTGPAVIEVYPKDGMGDVPVDCTIKVVFDEVIDSVVTSDKKRKQGDISLQDSDGNTIPIEYSISKSTLVIKPRSALKNGTGYTILVPSRSLIDRHGNMLKRDYKFTFTTVNSQQTSSKVDIKSIRR